MKSKISVIIRVKNEERWIGHSIQSVIDLFEKPEVIIIDNNSTDRSIEIIKRFIENPKYKKKNSNYTSIKIYTIDDYTPGKAINLGVKNASNEIILILSAHSILKQVDIDNVCDNLEKYISVFGNQVPIFEGKKITKRYIWSHFKKEKVVNMFSELENRYFHHNAFAFFKKQNLIKNKFDENLSGKEDRYWATEVIETKKQKILYDPELICEHHYTPNGATWKGSV